MPNINKRNVENKQLGGGKNSVVKKVRFSIEDVVFTRSTRKSTTDRIESGSILFWIAAFIVVLISSRYLLAYLHELDDEYSVKHDDIYTQLSFDVPCSNDYENVFKSCSPKKCRRVIKDNLFTNDELTALKSLAIKGMKYGGGSGGATILDLHSGALSYADKFVNVYKIAPDAFGKKDFALYSSIRNKILTTIATTFDIDKTKLYLTKPTFFSRMNNKPAVTKHDEYWHTHVDKVTYGTFYYTSLLYLSEYQTDFTGGRFIFVDKDSNKTIEPKFGRLSFFTSGSENQHFVEKVNSGTRYAITVSFTCDKKHAIRDPS